MTTSPSTIDSAVSSAATNAGRASAVAVASLFGLTMLGGTAAAYWSTTGVGTGFASTSPEKPVVSGVGTANESLYPGSDAALTLKLTNENDFPIQVTSLDADPAPEVTASSAACTTSDVTVNAVAGLTFEIGAGATETFEIGGAVAMGTNAASNCQGVTLTIAVTLQGESLAPAKLQQPGVAAPPSGDATPDNSSAVGDAPTATTDNTQDAALTDGAITTEETR